MLHKGFGLQVIVDGRPLPEIEHAGKTYFACELGKRFALQLIVPRYSRYEAVCSVDGLDVRTGKVASKDARGYVVTSAERRAENLIKGFRLNADEEAAFHFIGKDGSYAKLTDRPTHVGVIGAAFFSEYEDIILEGCLSFGDNERGGGTFGPRMKGGGLEHTAGTGFGERVENKVGTTSFRRDRQVAQFVLEYDFREQLVKAGIIASAPLGEVDPFPGDKPRPITGARPPVGWKG